MYRSFAILILLCMFLSACQPGPVPTAIAQETAPPQVDSTESPIPSTNTPQPNTVTPSPTTLPTTPPTETATVTPEPAGLIRVDTLEQEVYPFVENGRCSLAEAIIAANQKKQVDTCPPGGETESVIELMPGTYPLTQIDATPQQVDWAYSTTGTGNALPAIVRTLTMRGNGAVLSRQDASEPFRILEVLYGTFTLEDITLQGGEVKPEDWGGAMLVQQASLVMDGVTVKDSIAENGGGVYFTYGALTVRNSTFTGNEALFSGGGLYAAEMKAEITNSQFHDNIADGWGAGAFIEDAFITVSDCLFTGNRSNSRGGGINLQVVEAAVLRSQFYNNYASISGAGVSGRNYLYEDDIAEAEADPVEKWLQSSESAVQMATDIPGFIETLVAHPSGMFVPRKLRIEVHDSCFSGNTDSQPPAESATGIAGRTSSENNYFGHPSGPSGMGDGSGDAVGGEVAFEPFLTEPPPHCDLSLAGK